ncbi:GNAT family N-acetyltransferase [Luteimonas soli]|uniref:GNAT family N-acetyltransferase n=1 Tax=Luteimonas soli TaxID=1648966 RepID=A0ABV7XIB8_9GAMM
MAASDHAWKIPPRLAGRHVAIEPLSPVHAEGLRIALGDGELSRCWYTSVPAPGDAAAYIDAALEKQARGGSWAFSVLDAAGEVVGSTRYYDMDAAVPRLQVGYTFYAPRVQRTGVNTEAKLLLLGHAFEAMGCICVGFETSTHNQRSRAAIARLGARQDGILRSHRRHADGSVRDTVAFSIIEQEWPAVKHNLQQWLERGGRDHA